MKLRLDQRVFRDGLAPSRQRAQAMIMAGQVLVADEPVTKPGTKIDDDKPVRVRGKASGDWVSRGAHKLLPALDDWAVDPAGRVCLDVGASTGGFTHVLLSRGAPRVYAVDVGHNQLAWKLRADERVVVLEKTNARALSAEQIPEPVSLVVMDVSFISVTLILPALRALVTPDADLLIMVKPQFEVGKGRVGKGGVVRDEALRQQVIEDVAEKVRALRFDVLASRDNDIRGPQGNLEAFLHLRPS